MASSMNQQQNHAQWITTPTVSSIILQTLIIRTCWQGGAEVLPWSVLIFYFFTCTYSIAIVVLEL
jgi:hypothetical protein